MTHVSQALMVGGGIAGLSAAVALSRLGVRCEVVEIADAPLGASIAFSGRAAEALDYIGVYDACAATGRLFTNDTTAADQRDAAGGLLSHGPSRPNWPGAKDTVAVYRPELLRILEEEAFRLGAIIKRGMTITAIDDRDEGTLVTFSDGSEAPFDLVVGTDGIRSRTRELLFPDAPEPAYTGQVSVRWMCPGPAVDGEAWYHSPAGRIGLYYLPHQDVVYIPSVLDMPEWRWLSTEEVHDRFAALLDSFTAPTIQELRRRLKSDSQLILSAYHWVLMPEPWHRGRTILIGDAAHATTSHLGMGGGMALEDVAALAQSIEAAADLPMAFDRFMKRRFERVRTVVETSVALSRGEQAKLSNREKMAMMSKTFQLLGQPY